MNWELAKLKTESIAPWITIAGLIAGGVYSVIEYRDHQRQQRTETTMAYVTRFATSPLSNYRAEITKAWQRKQNETIEILSDKSLTRADLNWKYSRHIMQIVANVDLGLPLREMTLFFEQVANCVRLDLCDGEIVMSMLGNQAQEFIHQYYPHICFVREEWNDASYGASMERLFNPKGVGKRYCQEGGDNRLEDQHQQ